MKQIFGKALLLVLLLPSLSIAVELNKAPNPVTQFFKNHWGKLVAGTGVGGLWLATIARGAAESHAQLSVTFLDLYRSKQDTLSADRHIRSLALRMNNELIVPVLNKGEEKPQVLQAFKKEHENLIARIDRIDNLFENAQRAVNAALEDSHYHLERSGYWNIAKWVGVSIAAAATVTGIGYGIHKAIEHSKAKKKAIVVA